MTDTDMDLRKAYEQRQEARLDELDAVIDRLEATARRAAATAPVEGLERLRSDVGRARSLLRDLEATSGAAWEGLRPAYERAESELHDQVSAAADEIDRLAPQ